MFREQAENLFRGLVADLIAEHWDWDTLQGSPENSRST